MHAIRHRIARVMFACLFAFVSAAPVLAAEPAVVPSSVDAPSPAVVNVVGTPDPDKALVVFFRPKAFMGGGVRFKVRENEVELGKLANGTWFTVQAEPGEHQYVVHSEAKDVTRLEVEAGQTYFVSGSVSMGLLVGRPNLTPSDAAAFEAKIKKLKKAKPL